MEAQRWLLPWLFNECAPERKSEQRGLRLSVSVSVSVNVLSGVERFRGNYGVRPSTVYYPCNYKGMLEEYAQKSCINPPTYSFIEKLQDNQPMFTSSVRVGEKYFHEGTAFPRKMLAAQEVAKYALTCLDLSTTTISQELSYKNMLQELCQAWEIQLPTYDTVKEGVDHAPSFKSTVVVKLDVEIDHRSYTSEHGFSKKKKAEQDAARVALLNLKPKV
ncbi:Double-stranded RNA-binding protein 2 [Spatholobus suberectus]|nr:Double-stranded RNA-binding protein 2 [Spatholobus suberectus]